MAAASAVDVVREFWRLMATNDFDSLGAVLAPGFVLEWPQSNERIRGTERYARMNRECVAHGRWRFTIVRLFGDTGNAVAEVDVTDGVQRAKTVSLFACVNGKIERLVECWPEPFPARADRAHLVEPIAPRAGS